MANLPATPAKNQHIALADPSKFSTIVAMNIQGSDLAAMQEFFQLLDSLASQSDEQVSNSMLFYGLAGVCSGEYPLSVITNYYLDDPADTHALVSEAHSHGAGIAQQLSLLRSALESQPGSTA